MEVSCMSITGAGRCEQVQWTNPPWNHEIIICLQIIGRNETGAFMDWLNMFGGFDILLWDSCGMLLWPERSATFWSPVQLTQAHVRNTKNSFWIDNGLLANLSLHRRFNQRNHATHLKPNGWKLYNQTSVSHHSCEVWLWSNLFMSPTVSMD